ncbi:tyrosine-protein phosphatase [Gordoniibacillus kamchatkensis]|uniref:tyrosine-protein phosphatase n=1 Tax=Gordoniibacillus kamchatkensis TaxID=1590651 RepID=UPI00373AF1FD
MSPKPLFTADADYLQATFTAVIGKYGNWDAYFEKEHNMTPKMRVRIREYCLVAALNASRDGGFPQYRLQ